MPITSGFDIDMARPLTFYVVRLSDGEITQQLEYSGFGNNSLIVSHVVNAFLEDGKLVVDLVGYNFLFFNRFNSGHHLTTGTGSAV